MIGSSTIVLPSVTFVLENYHLWRNVVQDIVIWEVKADRKLGIFDWLQEKT
jgi:hypothetical protein